MHDACPHCGFSYEREPGFYLGSIYLNYGATVILTGALYAVLVMGLGLSNETALAVCLVAASCSPSTVQSTRTRHAVRRKSTRVPRRRRP
jgi:hypothetical protein